ncbi:hypothetical protein M405DRAFT_846352 [Rhizopogon salebrosus TDB-379]|nr:hypothetical protein M405DRAFT_846352 [Rhizopogon salebrosus TDB-379]
MPYLGTSTRQIKSLCTRWLRLHGGDREVGHHLRSCFDPGVASYFLRHVRASSGVNVVSRHMVATTGSWTMSGTIKWGITSRASAWARSTRCGIRKKKKEMTVRMRRERKKGRGGSGRPTSINKFPQTILTSVSRYTQAPAMVCRFLKDKATSQLLQLAFCKYRACQSTTSPSRSRKSIRGSEKLVRKADYAKLIGRHVPVKVVPRAP